MNAVTVQQEKRDLIGVLKSDDYQGKFKSMLPPEMSVERFTSVLIRAIQENPALMASDTDKPSLFLACQKAAQDGLLPDGKEGALVLYGKKASWLPMIFGLRKRLADVGFDLRADVVYANDTFDYDLGDDPRITHKAPPLGTERGKAIGAYAIATDKEGNKYREVMDLNQIKAVEAVSKGNGPWKGAFWSEMARKTVARRLIKSLPLPSDDRLQDLIRRDNENFDLSTVKAEPSAAAQAAQAAARAAPVQAQAEPPATAQDDDGAIDAEFTDTDQTGGTEDAGNDDGKPPF